MNEQQTSQQKEKDREFLNLELLQSTPRIPLSGRVIKKERVSVTSSQRIEADFGEGDKPSVFIHRTETGIESIEFVCSCGQRRKILIEYE